jgi:predicted membrane protein
VIQLIIHYWYSATTTSIAKFKMNKKNKKKNKKRKNIEKEEKIEIKRQRSN